MCDPRPPLDDCLPWGGVWPGANACWHFAWFARLVPGRGWVRRGVGEEGTVQELNRLQVEARWDRDRKRFVRRAEQTRRRSWTSALDLSALRRHSDTEAVEYPPLGGQVGRVSTPDAKDRPQSGIEIMPPVHG